MSIFANDINILEAKNSRVISHMKEKLTITFEIVNMEPISF